MKAKPCFDSKYFITLSVYSCRARFCNRDILVRISTLPLTSSEFSSCMLADHGYSAISASTPNSYCLFHPGLCPSWITLFDIAAIVVVPGSIRHWSIMGSMAGTAGYEPASELRFIASHRWLSSFMNSLLNGRCAVCKLWICRGSQIWGVNGAASLNQIQYILPSVNYRL